MVALDNPVIAQRFRGGGLESVHRGCWAVVSTEGDVLASAGDPQQMIFARSSSKSLQALVPLELGVVERFGLTADHVAVMVSSHNGEPVHVETVESLLSACGLDHSALQCGAVAPAARPDLSPSRLAHCCSGKHAGFLAGAVVLGQSPDTYLDPASELQQLIRSAMLRVTEAADHELVVAVDGCGAPTFGLRLDALGQGLARICNPAALSQPDRAHGETIVAAAKSNPHLIAGHAPRRFDTEVIAATQGRLFAKGGADGVQVVGVCDADIAFVGKVDDGNDRALVAIALTVLAELGHLSESEMAALTKWTDPVIYNAEGDAVGHQQLTATKS